MKKFFCTLGFVLAVGAAGALEVNRGEVESAGGSVEFENYGGPHAVIETARAITEIGGALGRLVAADVAKAATFGEGAKYTLVHAVSEGGEGRLDADILILNEKAGVDHIKNLRRILTGFLMEAYGYSAEDAQTIATFVTVYNAVYRGKLDEIKGKYKDDVVARLDPAKAGLSTNWSEWAGRTQIIIPLGDLGGAPAVETSEISDENVVQALRESEDKGIEDRSRMADIKEREGAGASEQAAAAQREASEKRPEATAARAEARRDPTNPDKKAAAETAEKAVDDAKKKAAEQQQIADRKKEEARREREEIRRDSLAAQGLPDLAKESYVNGLVRTDDKANLYGLVKVDTENGSVVRKSAVKNIRGTTIFSVSNVTVKSEAGEETFPTMYMAVCGTPDGRSAVKLCLIDALTLDMKKESAETLAEDSVLVQLGGDFFAVVSIDGEFYVGDYDQNLNLRRRSSVAVKPTTPLTVTTRGLMATGKDGSPVILKVADLDTLWGEKPAATGK